VVDKRNLTATVSIANIGAEVENYRRDSVMKRSQAHNVSAKTVHLLYVKMKKERSRRCQAITGFLTISNNVLTVGGLAWGEKQAGWPQPQFRRPPKWSWRSTKNGAVANFTKALRRYLKSCKTFIDIARSYAKIN
jgi:hypothetical protein